MTHVKDAPRPAYGRRAHGRSRVPAHPRVYALAAPAGAPDFDWGAAGWAGVIAGILYILIDSTLVALFTDSSSSTLVQQIAGIALRQSGAPTTSFSALVFFAATVVHLPLSLLYARVIAAVVRKMDAARAVECGAILGAGIYAMNYYGFTRWFPWFAAGRGWITLLSHVIFGAVAAGVYIMETSPERKTRRAALAR